MKKRPAGAPAPKPKASPKPKGKGKAKAKGKASPDLYYCVYFRKLHHASCSIPSYEDMENEAW